MTTSPAAGLVPTACGPLGPMSGGDLLAAGDRHCDELVEGEPQRLLLRRVYLIRFTPGRTRSPSAFLTEDTFTPTTARVKEGQGHQQPRDRVGVHHGPGHQVGAVLLVGVGQHSRVMPAQLGGRGGPRESALWTWSGSPAQSSPSARAGCRHGADVGLHPTGADRVAAAPWARWAQAIDRVSRSARAGHGLGPHRRAALQPAGLIVMPVRPSPNST